MSKVQDAIEDRTKAIGKYIVEYNATIRQAAGANGVGKSTAYLDVSKRLKEVDYKLYEEVREILDQNKAERHIRGGEATRLKFLRDKSI